VLSLKQVVSGARQAIGAIFPRWGGGGYGRYSIVLPNARYDYETQAGDLWQTSIVAIGIKWLGDRFPRPIFRVSKIGRGGKYTPYGQSDLADLWNHPNQFYGRRTLEKAIGLSLIVDGNAYIQKVRNRGGEVVELWWQPHNRVFPTWPSDGSEFIDGYRIRIDGFDWWLPKEDIIHIKDGEDPDNARLGLSAVKACLREVCTVNEESGYTASLLRNAGVPGMVLVPDDPKLRPTREDANEIKARMRESFGGEQRGSALILQGMFKVQTLSFSPEQLALDKLPTHAIARIAAAMGVAPMSLGLPDAGKTYSNLGEANRASWGTIQATQELVAETLRYQLLSDFGLDPEKNTPEYDYSEIQEMQESLDAIWKRVVEGYRGGVVTRNEGRDLLGFPQDPMGDNYFPGTGGTAEAIARENITIAEDHRVGDQGVTGARKPIPSPAPPPEPNGKPVNRITAATATNGKPKRWHLAFDSLEELEGKIDLFRNPAFDADGGMPSQTIIVAPETSEEPEPEPPPEPDQEKPVDPWQGY
jgi:HK97 family phage portal protein